MNSVCSSYIYSIYHLFWDIPGIDLIVKLGHEIFNG